MKKVFTILLATMGLSTGSFASENQDKTLLAVVNDTTKVVSVHIAAVGNDQYGPYEGQATSNAISPLQPGERYQLTPRKLGREYKNPLGYPMTSNFKTRVLVLDKPTPQAHLVSDTMGFGKSIRVVFNSKTNKYELES